MKKTFLKGIMGCAAWFGLICLGAAQTNEPLSEWTVRDQVSLADFVIQSHRGAGELAPENTLEAFELGWKLGTVPEADLRTTKDGVIVAFHDENFQRVVKGASLELQKKGVADTTFTELLTLDVGGWKGDQFQDRHVSKISEVFTLMKGRPERRLYLDIKNVDLKQLAVEVRAQQVGGQVILASPRYEIIREWKSLIPESQTLLWMGGPQAALKKRLDVLRAANFDGVAQLQVHIHLNTNSASAEPFTLSRQFIRSVGAELRSHGILYQTFPYGATRPRVYWQLLDLGVASFATDHPDTTLQAVADFYAKRFD